MAKALSIPATDNDQQEDAALEEHYRLIGQPTVPYGQHVEKLDAVAAIQEYRPSVVIACWVTHLYDPRKTELGGSQTAVDERAVIDACDEHIFVGNEHVHSSKPIWELQRARLMPSWVFSRAVNGSEDFAAIWRRSLLSSTAP